MAAYGLYTHIASNKFRSMLLLAGLFLLIYVAGLCRRAGRRSAAGSDQSVDYYLRGRGAIWSRPFPMRRSPPRYGS